LPTGSLSPQEIDADTLPAHITIKNPDWVKEIEACSKTREAKTQKGKKGALTPADIPKRSLRSNKGTNSTL